MHFSKNGHMDRTDIWTKRDFSFFDIQENGHVYKQRNNNIVHSVRCPFCPFLKDTFFACNVPVHSVQNLSRSFLVKREMEVPCNG